MHLPTEEERDASGETEATVVVLLKVGMDLQGHCHGPGGRRKTSELDMVYVSMQPSRRCSSKLG